MPCNRQDLVSGRFRGYYPVVVDVETGGFNAATDALLEVAAATFAVNEDGCWYVEQCTAHQVQPFEGAKLEPEALKFNRIDPEHALRKQLAVTEKQALENIFRIVRRRVKDYDCKRAILVGHNPSFDLNFINAAAQRSALKRNPFHPFSTFDTATLGGLIYGQTVLSRAVEAAGFSWDQDRAHSANYDAQMTAELFCAVVNQWRLPRRQPGL